MPPSRIVGVDYGTKRVGLALADPLRLFAQPFGTHPPAAAVEVLRELHDGDGIAVVVIGWPLLESGEEGTATERVQQFANRLRNALPGIEIVRWDERYTSELAKRQIASGGGSRKARRARGRIDAAAAGIILQEYLDAQR